MRIMFDEDSVDEIVYIDAVPYWDSEKGSTYENPEKYVVNFIHTRTNNDWNRGGNYILDGTIETYEKAKENFKKICRKLATEGWCSLKEDFENFKIW